LPWALVCLRVVDGQFHIHMAEVAPVETLDSMICIAVRMAAVVKIRLIVQSTRVGNKGIAVPFSNRITQPGGIHLFWKIAAVREHLPEAPLIFVENQHNARRLDKLERRRGHKHRIGDSVWKTSS